MCIRDMLVLASDARRQRSEVCGKMRRAWREAEAPFACAHVSQLPVYENILNTSLCNKARCIIENQVVDVRVLDRKAAVVPHCTRQARVHLVPSAQPKKGL